MRILLLKLLYWFTVASLNLIGVVFVSWVFSTALWGVSVNNTFFNIVGMVGILSGVFLSLVMVWGWVAAFQLNKYIFKNAK